MESREIKQSLWRGIKTPETSLLGYYQDLFVRNQNKWMKRSPLKVEDLNRVFLAAEDGIEREFILFGSVSPKEMMVKRSEDDKYYIVHSDEVDYLILGGKRKR